MEKEDGITSYESCAAENEYGRHLGAERRTVMLAGCWCSRDKMRLLAENEMRLAGCLVCNMSQGVVLTTLLYVCNVSRHLLTTPDAGHSPAPHGTFYRLSELVISIGARARGNDVPAHFYVQPMLLHRAVGNSDPVPHSQMLTWRLSQ